MFQNKYSKIVLLLGVLFITSCNNLIYDDLKDCTQGVYLSFYSMTPCAVDTTYIGKVSSLSVFAFDQEDKLVTYQQTKDVNLDEDYQLLMPLRNGRYSFIAWANLTDNIFSLAPLKVGHTTKKDILFSIQSKDEEAANLSSHQVWLGESKDIELPNPSKYGSIFKYSKINLQEKTNRISVIVEIDESIQKAVPEDFIVEISSGNSMVNINGSMPFNSPILKYPGLTTYTSNSLQMDFVTLDLVTGYNNTLSVTNKKTNHVVFKGDLIGSILLNTITNNINLACERDFIIKLKLRDKCADCGTYYACELEVNGWRVHSYEIEF